MDTTILNLPNLALIYVEAFISFICLLKLLLPAAAMHHRTLILFSKITAKEEMNSFLPHFHKMLNYCLEASPTLSIYI